MRPTPRASEAVPVDPVDGHVGSDFPARADGPFHRHVADDQPAAEQIPVSSPAAVIRSG